MSEVNEDGLLACPFCGDSNISHHEVMGKRENGAFFFQTACLNCGACGPESDKTPNFDADMGWNERIQPR